MYGAVWRRRHFACRKFPQAKGQCQTSESSVTLKFLRFSRVAICTRRNKITCAHAAPHRAPFRTVNKICSIFLLLFFFFFVFFFFAKAFIALRFERISYSFKGYFFFYFCVLFVELNAGLVPLRAKVIPTGILVFNCVSPCSVMSMLMISNLTSKYFAGVDYIVRPKILR